MFQHLHALSIYFLSGSWLKDSLNLWKINWGGWIQLLLLLIHHLSWLVHLGSLGHIFFGIPVCWDFIGCEHWTHFVVAFGKRRFCLKLFLIFVSTTLYWLNVFDILTWLNIGALFYQVLVYDLSHIELSFAGVVDRSPCQLALELR